VNHKLPFLFSISALALASCKPQTKAPDSTFSPPASPTTQGNDATSTDRKASQAAAKIRKIVAEQLNLSPDRILLTSTWQQLGADSLDIVELVMAFEEEFHVEISDERAVAMKTVGDAVTFLTQHAEQ